MNNGKCFHCENEIKIQEQILFVDKEFCCVGCNTVYEIFSHNNVIARLSNFLAIQKRFELYQ
jgi:Cu+-exporting ATPase